MSAPAGRRQSPPQHGLVGPQLHVVMDGREIAVLTSPRAGQAKLTYLPAAAAHTRGLSCNLKVTTPRHSGAPVINWISGLLPDRSEVLARWRSRFELKRQDAYALLWHVGEDVAGAARFVRPDRMDHLDDDGDAEPVPHETIGERIRALSADAAGWAPSLGTGQFSLAGAQAKFALARTGDGQWVETSGGRPTTHIFKPAIPRMDDQDLGEHLTMRLAAAVGLPVAHSEVMEFAGARCLVVTRFDRCQGPDGTWRRIHQEDAVQALGMAPLQKYEESGGPGVRAIAALLRANVTADHENEDVVSLIDAIAFNWLVAGTDAHARNYSLLHTRSQTRLAPLYDLNSFLPYVSPGQPVNLSMKIGYTERDPARVSANDWVELARDCGIDPDIALTHVSALADNLRVAVDNIAADTSLDRWGSPLPQRLADLITSHITACQRRL